jgi:hypothetical protein
VHRRRIAEAVALVEVEIEEEEDAAGAGVRPIRGLEKRALGRRE